MHYSILSFLFAWIFPTKDDRERFRTFCRELDARKNSELIQQRYSKIIKKLQNDFQTRKLKVVFLSSENSKWVYQSIYEEFSQNPHFEVQILVTVRETLLKKKYRFCEWEKLAKNSYNFFKNQNMNVDFAFDFKKKKFKDLKEFNPDIIFYEQPWDLSKEQSIIKTSNYAISFYCSYGSCITNGKNEYSEVFYKDVYTYFLDNVSVKNVLIEHGCNPDSLTVSGQPKLDAYLKPVNESNIQWKTKNQKRVIWAPHHSFYEESTLGFGTFEWNYKFLYDFAKNHPEIEFILKPHPDLKRQIVRNNLMSISEMTEYFKMWEQLPNAQVYEMGNYFDIFRTSDLLITDCNSFLYEYLPTKKPVIQLISKNSVGHNDYGQKIVSGYYKANTIEELEELVNKVLINGEDPLLSVREKVIAEDLVQPSKGVANFILNFVLKIFSYEGES